MTTLPVSDDERLQAPPIHGGEKLPALARAAISADLSGRPLPEPPDEWKEPGASFVTLTREGRLRGCIGSLVPRRSLGDDVVGNARSAAFRDPRFPPLTDRELEGLRIEVSVLSAPSPIPAATRQDALAAMRPGVDGVILEAGAHRATFLPQVWDQLPDPEEFLGQLMRKAGLPAGFWSEEVRLSRYAVTVFKETV
ncbi:MAG TPA: AmmeMemoRadiSam system protein A [Actinomycetaceae bacterium]|nr:AmmeMemoRadiSam system protein A [Actinomycetaceae bacterium]